MINLLLIIIIVLVFITILLIFFIPATFSRIVYQFMTYFEAKFYGLHQGSIDIGEMKINLLKNNSPEKPTIVMLHGFSADKLTWLRFSSFFTKQYNIVIPDLAGHGKTGFDKSWDYSCPAQVERIVKLLDKLALKKVHLVGNSMGGFITAHFAKMYPERTLSITLIDPAGVNSPVKSVAEKMIAQNKNPFDINSRAEFDTFFAMTMAKPPWLYRFFLSALSDHYQQHKVELMQIFNDFYGKDMLDNNLDKIKAPTLLLWGEEDQLINVKTTDVWQAGINNITVKTWPSTGHMPMVEIPRESATECLKFIKKHEFL